jgi:LmbE family N-acetylglucosaminyl deacetylase
MDPAQERTVLTVMAHPDDAEFLCGGTLSLLAEAGWRVHIASATPGDCGTATLSQEEISSIRRAEGRAAAALLGGSYHCLEARDLLVFYEEVLLRRATALLRRVRPDVVITHNPQDYMPDHEQISMVARAACFNAPIPNAPVGPLPEDRESQPRRDPPAPRIPHLYYADPVEGKDTLGAPVRPTLLIDVSRVLEKKERLLAAHVSQREWLRHHHGMDEYLESMRRWGAERGRLIGARSAEGYRQHRGHPFPQDDLLRSTLGPAARALAGAPPAVVEG